jgi:AbrB family looped-hinge helix DNA binding protein
MSQFKLSSKGQVTIPLEIRQFLRLEPGDAVRFDVKDGKVVLMPQASDRHEALKKLQTAYQKKEGKKKPVTHSSLEVGIKMMRRFSLVRKKNSCIKPPHTKLT